MITSYGVAAALAVETRKVVASRTVLATGVLSIVGVSLLVGGVIIAVRSGSPEVAVKLGSAVQGGGWVGFWSAAGQVTSAGLLLAFGTMISWLFGREFAEQTITGLFGLPVSRATIALAKMLVFLGWGVLISVMLAAVLLITGLGIGLGPPDAVVWSMVGRQTILGALTALVAAPAALAATLGRGVLPGVAATVVLIISAQVLVLVGGAAVWWPVAVPALWALGMGEVAPMALVLPGATFVGATLATMALWSRLQLDR